MQFRFRIGMTVFHVNAPNGGPGIIQSFVWEEGRKNYKTPKVEVLWQSGHRGIHFQWELKKTTPGSKNQYTVSHLPKGD